MSITSWHIYAYDLPLKRPLAVKDSRTSHRTGFLIQVSDNAGIEGWGEIAPLEKFSRESAEEARSQLLDLSVDLLQRIYNDSPDASDDYGLLPSVDFGVCAALLCLKANRDGVRVARLLSNRETDAIRVNALIDCRSEELADTVSDCLSCGYSTFKLKLGRGSRDGDIELSKELLGLLPDDTRLRLDCNRSWQQSDLMRFLQSVPVDKVEYIEEPLVELRDYITLPDKISFPLALDESLMNSKPDEIVTVERLRCLVLKPTCLGFGRTLKFVNAARSKGIGVTFTSAFESSIGIGFIAELAAAFMPGDRAAGLGTLNWFESDTVKKPLRVAGGCLESGKTLLSSNDIRFDSLVEIASHG